VVRDYVGEDDWRVSEAKEQRKAEALADLELENKWRKEKGLPPLPKVPWWRKESLCVEECSECISDLVSSVEAWSSSEEGAWTISFEDKKSAREIVGNTLLDMEEKINTWENIGCIKKETAEKLRQRIDQLLETDYGKFRRDYGEMSYGLHKLIDEIRTKLPKDMANYCCKVR